MDAALRLRAEPEVRQLIGESERLLRLLFLINAPGSDWSVNEAYQERAFQQAGQAGQAATQGKDGQADWALGADLLGAARKSYT